MRREKRLLGDTAHAHGVAGVARQVFSGRGAEERQCPSTPLRFSLDALRAFPARYRSPSPLWRQRMTWVRLEAGSVDGRGRWSLGAAGWARSGLPRPAPLPLLVQS